MPVLHTHERGIVNSNNNYEKDMSFCNHEDTHQSLTKYVLSIFHAYLELVKYKKPKSAHKLFDSGGGLKPHTPTRSTDAYITAQTVTAPITIMDDRHEPHEWDYLSKSDSSSVSGSSGSSWSSIGSPTAAGSDHHRRRSVSCITLSEILCDHYVQTHQAKASNNDNLSFPKEVPLETYKVFEATRRHSSSSSHLKHLGSSNGNVSDIEHDNTDNDNSCGDDDDEDESWFIWDSMQKTREWIQVVDQELFLPKESEVAAVVALTAEHKPRGIRDNPAHLRMIVAEVNMMRADKIVCPLRERALLPARTDVFKRNTPSPLGKYSSCMLC